MTISEFADGYDEWRKLRDWSLGPVIRPNLKKDPERFTKLTSMLSSRLNFSQIEDGAGQIMVESPWHASFLLDQIQSMTISNGWGNMLFRGQANSDWKIVPSIDRENLTSFSGARKLMESLAFRELVANLHTDLTIFDHNMPEGGLKLALPKEAYVPVAQHYGFITELVDFTADPTVAVYFAANTESSERERNARVFVTRLGAKEHLFDKFHLRLVPPYFRRPYLQKGVFIQSMMRGDIEEGYRPDFIIDFPVDKIERNFQIIRGDIIDILPEDNNIKILSGLAEKAFINFLDEEGFGEFDIQKFFGFIKDFSKEVDDNIKPLYKSEVHKVFGYFVDFVSELEEMFYWLCYFTNYEENGGIGLNIDVFDRLIDHNPEIMLFFAKMYKFFIRSSSYHKKAEPQQIEWRRALSNHIYERLENAGYDPSRKLSFDDLIKARERS